MLFTHHSVTARSLQMIVISLFAFTSDFRGCDVHRTTGARDEGPHRLAHDTEPRRGDCDLFAAAYEDLPTRSLKGLESGHVDITFTKRRR